MANETQANLESDRNETQSEPGIRERLETLKEKTSRLSETVSRIERTLRGGSVKSVQGNRDDR